jgi:hypothetical protein
MSVAHCFYSSPTSPIIVLCPHCSQIHEHPASTGRLVEIPAACDGSLTYSISATMKEVAVVSALKGYFYDLERKRKHYHRTKKLVGKADQN